MSRYEKTKYAREAELPDGFYQNGTETNFYKKKQERKQRIKMTSRPEFCKWSASDDCESIKCSSPRELPATRPLWDKLLLSNK